MSQATSPRSSLHSDDFACSCPYGISPATEIVQARMHAALSGLNGVHCIADDDVLVSSSGDTLADAERDHDANLLALLERCRQINVELTEQSCLNRQSTSYMGHLLINVVRLRPDPRKIEAILQMPPYP